jgi:hypothetical protein
MNGKTTKQAAAGTTKAMRTTSGKGSRQAATVGRTGNESATQAEPAQRKRRKPFVL